MNGSHAHNQKENLEANSNYLILGYVVFTEIEICYCLNTFLNNCKINLTSRLKKNYGVEMGYAEYFYLFKNFNFTTFP